ncbi:YbaB/EbfC family nucleoid-associated protein [Actinokineospora auranticolor]|uniref:YbaB/EbfC DNA-binding family protein n=1 Tax=Actinokineospora auranticolor TaxID=155976 RepID=A0A2S6GZ89_9PSEU|nr:YbaB/EbfC family nucleoid-associated protein [Actinokineospora auranticolor]PPK70477.1 YbaB/EbfC DNA-binding family protein [Actinokineospora auranticolor]
MNPEQWLAQYDETLKKAAASAQKADKALREVGGSATSTDGEISVHVSAGGATTGLVLRSGVRDYEPEQLARAILAVTREAQRDASAKVVATMEELVGDSPALDVVKAHLPQGYAGDAEDDTDAPPAKPRDRPSDDEYFDNPPEVVH